jgi:predicted RNase H-like nuclease (RuvC/YqgF family)
MDSLQDSELKIKKLEMYVAQLERELVEMQEDIEELKRYMIKVVSHQTSMSEKFKMWPYVLVRQSGE